MVTGWGDVVGDAGRQRSRHLEPAFDLRTIEAARAGWDYDIMTGVRRPGRRRTRITYAAA